MRYIKQYLKDRWKSLLALPIAAGVFYFVLWLYKLPPAPALYAGALACAALFFLFALPDLFSYVRRAKALSALSRSLSTLSEIPDFYFPSASPLPERELEDMVRQLCKKAAHLENTFRQRQEDMLGYYTLWVHQVKTPLSALRLILQSAGEGRLSEDVREALLQELFKIERYVEMVLGYLRLDSMSANLRLERCRLSSLVRQAVKKFAPLFIYHKLSLDLQDFDNVVLTDEKWLVFVLEQLLSNALKYTSEGGVSIFVEPMDVLVIQDTGRGIAPEDLPRVFERGFTGQNGRLEKTSTGLGLYLSKQILDRLQNRIEIVSAPGEGTQVRLYLHRENAAIF